MHFFVKILTGLLLVLVIVLSFPHKLHAQGTYTCAISGGGCGPGASSCEPGYEPPIPHPCNGYDYNDCNYIVLNNSQYNCVSEEANQGSVEVSNGPGIETCGIRTAIGCIPIQDENRLALFFLEWGLGLGGGIALIVMVIATFMMMTSGGDPRKFQAGKELLISAITGLFLLGFSAWLLNFIGVDLLQLFDS